MSARPEFQGSTVDFGVAPTSNFERLTMDDRPGGESPLISRQGRIGATVAAIAVAFFLIRLLGAPWPHFPPTFPDSFSYLKVATRGPFHTHFYFDERPIGYPLFLWSMGRSSTLTVVGQTLVYAASFGVLSWVVFAEMRSRVVGIAAIVFFAGLAIEPRNSLWNLLILSESLSMSASVLTIAAWFRAAARPSKRTISLAWIATVVWILVRDTNVAPTLAVIVPAAVLTVWASPDGDRALRRRLLVGAGLVVALCGYVYVSQAVTLRNQYPMNNNVGMRILPDPAMTKWFEQGGMPVDAALLARTNHNSWDDSEAFLRAPNLAHYRSWARGQGTRRLMMSMGLKSSFWWRRLHNELPHILRGTDKEYDGYGVFDRLPSKLPGPFGEPRTNAAFFVELILGAVGLAIAAADSRRRLLALAMAIGFGSALLDIWISYIGDAMEVNRHLVGPLVRINVFVIIGVMLGLDALVASVRRQRAAVGSDADEPEKDAPLSAAEEVSADA
jgi:hypothetical protein